MGLLIKIFPFLFRFGPDQKYYWFFRNWIKVEFNGEAMHSLWSGETFILSRDVDAKLKEKDEQRERIIIDWEVGSEEFNKRIDVLKLQVETSNNAIECNDQKYLDLKGSYNELLYNREKLVIEIGKKEGKIKELKENFVSMKESKFNAMNSLKKEVSYKEEIIGELRETINNERVAVSNERFSLRVW